MRLSPTTSLRSLMPLALLLAPPRLPRLRIPRPGRHRKARAFPEGRLAQPTTSPCSLIPLPSLNGPPRVPRFRTVNCCSAATAVAGGVTDGSAGRVGSLQAPRPVRARTPNIVRFIKDLLLRRDLGRVWL